MHCPRCSKARELKDRALKADDVEVTVRECPKCHGQLFERGAFTQVSEVPRTYDVDLSRIPEPGEQLHPLACPSCGDGPMMKVQSRREKSVTMDLCASCSSIWLDSGELDAIRGREATFARAAYDWVKDKLD
jgi:Zn-finger nucleic acid-binding protein